MNTKKLFTGLAAVAFFAFTVVSTSVIADDVFKTEVNIDKKKLVKDRH